MDIPRTVSSEHGPTGDMGQRYLVVGRNVAMRRWTESKGGPSEVHQRDYETVGYLVSGQLQVDIAGQRATIGPGESWIVPAGAAHTYRILEPIVAVEATSPPARLGKKDSIEGS